MDAANDNKTPKEWFDLIEANRRYGIFTDKELLQLKHRPPSAIANYTWFVAFEGGFREKARALKIEENRKKIQVIK